MNGRHVWLTYIKELRETVRDRRTLAVMVLFPLVVYPLLAVLTTHVLFDRETRLEEKVTRVSAPDDSTVAVTLRAVAKDRPEELVFLQGKNVSDIQRDTLDVFAEAKKPADPSASTSEEVMLRFDGTLERSRRGKDRVAEALSARLPPGCTPVFLMESEDVASREDTGSYLLSKVLPLLIVMMLMLGAFYPAIDVTAGERERGTLETTLVAPVLRFDLLVGKVLAVATLALITAVMNLGSMSLTVVQALHVAKPDVSLPVPWSRIVAITVVLIPTALLFASIMVTVATSARSFKEAQNVLTPMYFVLFTPAAIAGMGDHDLTAGMALIPGLNVTLLARDLTMGRATVPLVAITVLSTLLFAGVVLKLATRLFDSERLLAVEDAKKARKDRVRGRQGDWNAGDAMLLFALGFILLVAFAPLQARNLEIGVLAGQWLGMFGLVAVVVRARGKKLVEVIHWQPVRPGVMAGAFVMGMSAWMIVGLVSQWVLPAPEKVVQELRELVLAQGQRPMLVTLLLVGLTPAICEEVLFRGGILRGLVPRVGQRVSIVLCAAMFALYHLSIYRLLPTFGLGLMLSWLAIVSGSIRPAILAHLTNNALLVLLADQQLDTDAAEVAPSIQIAMLVVAGAVFGFGARLVWRNRNPDQSKDASRLPPENPNVV